jgi:hypothetical protein
MGRGATFGVWAIARSGGFAMNEIMQHDDMDGVPRINMTAQPAVWRQLRANIVAIVSIVVALGGLAYGTWRNEKTEANRNTRIAAFEVLKTLGELQLIVDYAYYRKDPTQGDSTIGWRRVLCIKDLAQIVPSPGPEDAERLLQTWRTSVETLNADPQSAARISDEIYATRQDMVAIIQRLR